MKNFYVYYSYEEWGRGYIGRRECLCLPVEDVKYFGSFKDKTFNPTQKIILATFKTREEAVASEIALHEFFQVDVNPHFANKAKQTSVGFSYDSTGQPRSPEWIKSMSGDNHPNKLEENRKKISQGLKALGENHHSKRPEHRERARKLLSSKNSPIRTPEAREKRRITMSDPAKKEILKQAGRKSIAKRIQSDPDCQRKASLKCHEAKDELGRSLHGLRMYEEYLSKVPVEVFKESARILNSTKYYDPEHPELGERSVGTLVRMQKARGYPHGPKNRVKVTIKEEP